MDVVELAPGLWRWTTPHPAWTPADEQDWAEEVGCVYCEIDGAIAMIDPLVPQEAVDRERFWRALDRDVVRLGAPLVVTTVSDHVRSVADVGERYGPSARKVGEVAGLTTFPTERFEEIVVWLEPYRALVTGDVLLGDGAGGVRVCPDDWNEGLQRDVVWASLQPLLDLPVERILVSHGAPVLAGGREALARALGE